MSNQVDAGELIGSDVLGRSGGLAADELEVVAWRDIDDRAAGALHTWFAIEVVE